MPLSWLTVLSSISTLPPSFEQVAVSPWLWAKIVHRCRTLLCLVLVVPLATEKAELLFFFSKDFKRSGRKANQRGVLSG